MMTIYSANPHTAFRGKVEVLATSLKTTT